MLALALLYGALVGVPGRADAADPSTVGLGTDTLMIGILFEQEAGTYLQESQVANGQLFARLTFHLPAAPTTAQPGPVIVFWQLRIDVADEMYGDSLQTLVGPPVVQAVLPDCDAAGACDLQVAVGGSITPALEAADLDWVSGARLYVAVTLARTYADGTLLQAVRPQLGSGGSRHFGPAHGHHRRVDPVGAHLSECGRDSTRGDPDGGIWDRRSTVRLGRRGGRGARHEHAVTIRLTNRNEHSGTVSIAGNDSGP